MAQNSNIEWTHHTNNIYHGCSKVHTGCKNCYAENLARRYGFDIWGVNKPRKLIKSAFGDLGRFQRLAAKEETRVRVFCGSMMDIFEEEKPLIDHKGNKLDKTTIDLRRELFTNIQNGEYPNLIFLMLTKRPSNVKNVLSQTCPAWLNGFPNSVWLGTSISDQKTADEYVSSLIKDTPKANHFLSVEPQVGAVDLSGFLIPKGDLKNGVLKQPIKWIIQGGESGDRKRPFNLSWAYSMREQCKEAGVAYFFKQIDKIQAIPEDLLVREFPIM